MHIDMLRKVSSRRERRAVRQELSQASPGNIFFKGTNSLTYPIVFLFVLPGFAEKTCLAVLSGRASGKRQREKTGGWTCPWGQHHHHHRHHHLCYQHHHHYNSCHITDIPLSLPSSIHDRYQISTTSADGSSVLQSARTRLRRDLGG